MLGLARPTEPLGRAVQLKRYALEIIMKVIDARKVQDLVIELFDDYKETLDDFTESHNEELVEFSEIISECHKKYQLFNNINNPSDRVIQVGAFVYLSFDNAYTSMKLLMLGYLTPSGNMLRQSFESVCMAVLLATDCEIEIAKKKGKIKFYEDFVNDRKHAQSHRAVSYVNDNQEILRVNDKSMSSLIKGKRFYNEYSHPTKMSMASRLTPENNKTWMIGGGYDTGKKPIYDIEIETRVNYCGMLPTFIQEVFDRAKHA